jgi:DNA helicase HerA-like ATPase
MVHIKKPARFVAVRTGNSRITSSYLRKTRRRYRYLYLSVYDLTPDQTKAFLSGLISAVKEVGNLALIIDEAHLFLSRFQAPPKVIGFVRGARFYGVDVIMVTHRLKDIDIGIRCVITHMMLFRSVDRGDIDVLAHELGMGDAAEVIQELLDRTHIFVNRRTGYVSPKTQI